ncbi:MAG: hypothetical protein V1784_12530 [bacterium]
MKEKQVLIGIRGTAFLMSAVALAIIPDWTNLPRLFSTVPIVVIPVERILEWRTPPPPPPLPTRTQKAAESSAPHMAWAPTTGMPLAGQMDIAGASTEPAEFGLLDMALETPVEWQPRIEPEASPLPEIVTRQAESGENRLPMALPGALPSRGEVYQGRGASDLPAPSRPSYTGPMMDAPGTALPQLGTARGTEAPATSLPGLPTGEKYRSPAGLSEGQTISDKLSLGEDIVDEEILSGLLRWLRGQKGAFAQVVMDYLETKPGHLKGRARFQGWDIHVQFSEVEHQLKLLLVQGETAILLADSDFRQRSQFLGLCRVTPSPAGPTAIVAVRDRPTLERTRDFYEVFAGWMESEGISLGPKAAKR